MQEGFELGIRRVRFAEDFHDLTFGVNVGLGPVEETYDELVTNFRPWAQFETRGIGDEDVAADAGVVRHDVVEHARLLQGAGDGRVCALEDADDARVEAIIFTWNRKCARTLDSGFGFKIAQAHEDVVAVQRDAGAFATDKEDFAIRDVFGIIGGDDSRAALTKTNGAADEVGIPRDAVAVAFDPRNRAFFKKDVQGVAQAADVFFAELEGLREVA